MAGFIFSIASNDGIDGVKKCIRNGYFASIAPQPNNSTGKQILAGVLADYCSMKTGDNVYFLSKRKIYGVGKLVNIHNDCKYKNYISANKFEKITKTDYPLVELDAKYRWICFFEPEQQFFVEGIDMDDVLMYKPNAFRQLRAFQDITFIKIDDEENRALKECIYIKNRREKETIQFDESEHRRISKMDLSKYLIKPEETIKDEYNDDTKEISLEMLLEASMVNHINCEGFQGVNYDYVTHQVIASPFKPLKYIDKIDVLAYKYLEDYPDEIKPVEKYLVIELKKAKGNKDVPLQLMKYVDWISKEYASGDYSLIKAVAIANGYTNGIQKTIENECERSFLSKTHPNVTEKWNDLTLYEYSVNGGKVTIKESNLFEVTAELSDELLKLGFEISKSSLTVKRIKYKPCIKIKNKKWLFFNGIVKRDKEILEENGWIVRDISNIKNREKIKAMLKELINI